MKKRLSFNGGFSILEVLITAAIIGAITGIIVLKYGSFNNVILLKNQAYQIGLDTRMMQTRALSAQGYNGVGFYDAYGIYAELANPDRYILFLDVDSDGYYDSNEGIDRVRLDSRFRVSRICVASNCDATAVSVSFRRPNFDAIINNGSASSAQIFVAPVNGTGERRVYINAVGQISVQ